MKLLVLYYTLHYQMIKQVLEKYDYRYLVYLIKYDINVYIIINYKYRRINYDWASVIIFLLMSKF